MKQEHLREMANRCRRLANAADRFTRRRLLGLAAKYEGQLDAPSPASAQLTEASIDRQSIQKS